MRGQQDKSVEGGHANVLVRTRGLRENLVAILDLIFGMHGVWGVWVGVEDSNANLIAIVIYDVNESVTIPFISCPIIVRWNMCRLDFILNFFLPHKYAILVPQLENKSLSDM